MGITVELLRPEDFVHLTIEGYNLRFDADMPGGPALVREDPAADAFLVVVFPPQSFAEGVLQEVDPPSGSETPVPPGVSEAPVPPGDLQARLSGASRLAFRVPSTVVIPFSIEGLLDWSKLEPSLTRVGAVRGQGGIFLPGHAPRVTRPTATETAIELPYRLFLSPGLDARWRHPLRPVANGGRTLMWCTRLVNVAEGGEEVELDANHTAPIRAVFSPDYDPYDPPPQSKPAEFPMPLKPSDRHALVRLTSTFPTIPIVGHGGDLGLPAEARRLSLSSLGGFLDAEGRWPNGPISFDSWKHIATLGRDSFVRTTYRGRLFPLMNRATLIRISERRFEPFGGSPTAYLRQYRRILVNQREVAYDETLFIHDGREMPLRSIRINVDKTPKIDPEVYIGWPGPPPGLTSSFEVRLGGVFWPFPCTAMDRDGTAIDFNMGLIFVPDDDIPDRLDVIAGHYAGLPKPTTVATAANTKIKLADFGNTSETTAFMVAGLHFDVDLGRGPAGFLPKLGGIDVRVPSLELLTGSSKPTSISFTTSYLNAGFDAAAGLFAEVAGGTSMPVGFAADQAGGIVRPDLSVRGFSRAFGPIAGDLTGVPAGKLDLSSAFGSLDAKLFGALPIKDLLGTNALSEAAPKIVTELGPNPSAPTQAVTRLLWQTGTKDCKVGAVSFVPGGRTKLAIEVAHTKSLVGEAEATTSVDGRLDDFSIELLDVMLIRIAEFRFGSGTKKATTVELKLGDQVPIEFKGALDFVRKLSELMPPGIFGANGPRLILRPDAIEVGFALALPPAALGVFSIRNIAISTALTLPFLTGRPSVAFAFATREKPFQVAVLILGGGGFVRVELDAEGVRAVEVMFEFGGMFALDVGVASGSVHILAGIYIGLKGEASELTGYVRVGGEVTVLAIISISVEFMLSLSYYINLKLAKGVAKVTVSIRIAFISQSLSFSVERTFSSGSKHLSIAEAMDATDWAAYAAAFD